MYYSIRYLFHNIVFASKHFVQFNFPAWLQQTLVYIKYKALIIYTTIFALNMAVDWFAASRSVQQKLVSEVRASETNAVTLYTYYIFHSPNMALYWPFPNRPLKNHLLPHLSLTLFSIDVINSKINQTLQIHLLEKKTLNLYAKNTLKGKPKPTQTYNFEEY